MKFIELEINKNIEVGKIYTLPNLIKAMNKDFYEKWEQHLTSTTLTPQELYKKNYHLEFKDYGDSYDSSLQYIYLLNENKKIIGELELLYIDNKYKDYNYITCSFCRNGERQYKASEIYKEFNLIDNELFPIHYENSYKQDCYQCDKGTMEYYGVDFVPNEVKIIHYIYVKNIKYYDKFEYFENGNLVLGVKYE